MNQRVKNHRTWAKELKQWWIEQGYPQYCEMCSGSFGLAFAHSQKRRFIHTKELYWEVALLCQMCHEKVEFSGHENMKRQIKEIIDGRTI
jgi:hypothetical protein